MIWLNPFKASDPGSFGPLVENLNKLAGKHASLASKRDKFKPVLFNNELVYEYLVVVL